MRVERLVPLVLVAALGAHATPALAHVGGGVGGFTSGFYHPLLGLDHVVAMVAVGLWAALLGARAVWRLPTVFPLLMALGGMFGVLGVPVPAVEAGIGSSAVVLGLLIAFAARLPVWVAALIVGTFAVFHGHAHGSELPEAANAIAYSLGFLLTTGLLHLAGILFGLLARWPAGKMAVRAGGGGIALAGVGFLSGLA